MLKKISMTHKHTHTHTHTYIYIDEIIFDWTKLYGLSCQAHDLGYGIHWV